MKKAIATAVTAMALLAPTMCSAQAVNDAFVDDHFDRGDMAADAAGVLMYQVRF